MQSKKTNQQDKIEPPDGWKLDSVHGILRFGPEAGDKIVTLHDVVTWLMAVRELPFANAVEAVCSALEKNGLDGIYLLERTEYAKPVTRPSPFDQFLPPRTGATIAKNLRATWLIEPWELARLVNTPDLEIAFDESKETPFAHANRPGNPSALYAITWALAHKYWGWGSVANVVQLQSVDVPIEKEPTTFAQLVRFRKDHPGSEWTLNQKAILAREARTRHEKPGAQRVSEAIADKLGITISRVNDLISKADSGGKRAYARSRAV